MKHVILGTAGHIDHGKTTLVKALTGTDTDRLPEEKARGITIDLGFAHLQLADLSVGVVDVPGHEALIRNMLAGATGFDGVLLVVAADEGIMPQTHEHFAIAELLGIERLIVAITKCDLVDPDWLELVQTEVGEWLSHTPFARAPVIATSATAESGIAELREALLNELSKAAERRTTDLFRMPVDRVFTVRGTGTVVTGTVWSGSAARDDAARVLPGARTVRIRGCQTHGSAVDRAYAGERAAFAIAGSDRGDLVRGDVLVLEDAWQAVDTVTARVRTLADVQLKHRQRVRVHLGTAEVMARVVLLGDQWLQLRLEAPLVARAGDRFVLRSYSPVATIAGGIVADVARVRKRLTPEESNWLTQVIDGDANQRVAAAVNL
jgi:selenocysteine-specific elongation factor